MNKIDSLIHQINNDNIEYKKGKFAIPLSDLSIDKRVHKLVKRITRIQNFKSSVIGHVKALKAEWKIQGYVKNADIQNTLNLGADLLKIHVENNILDLETELLKKQNEITAHVENLQKLIKSTEKCIATEKTEIERQKPTGIFNKLKQKNDNNSVVLQDLLKQKTQLDQQYIACKDLPAKIEQALQLYYAWNSSAFDGHLLARMKQELNAIQVPTEKQLDEMFFPEKLTVEGMKIAVEMELEFVSELLKQAQDCVRTIKKQEAFQKSDLNWLLESVVITPVEDLDPKVNALKSLLCNVKSQGKLKIEREEIKIEKQRSASLVQNLQNQLNNNIQIQNSPQQKPKLNVNLFESYNPVKFEEAMIQQTQMQNFMSPQIVNEPFFSRVLKFEVPLLLSIMPPQNWNYDQFSNTYFWVTEQAQFSAVFDQQTNQYVISSSGSNYTYVWDHQRISLLLAGPYAASLIDPDFILNKTSEDLNILNAVPQNGWMFDHQQGDYVFNAGTKFFRSYSDQFGIVRAFSSEQPCLSYFIGDQGWEFWPGEQPHLIVPQEQQVMSNQLFTQSQTLKNDLSQSLSFSQIQKPKDSIYQDKIIEKPKANVEGFKNLLTSSALSNSVIFDDSIIIPKSKSLDNSQIFEKSLFIDENAYWEKQEELLFNGIGFDLKKDYSDLGIMIVDYDPISQTLLSSTTGNTFHTWLMKNGKWEIVK